MKGRTAEAWDKMRPPTSAKERIAYLHACYAHFTAALESHPDQRPAIVSRAGGGEVDPPRMHGASELVALPESATFACTTCGAPSSMSAHSAAIANPYSKWIVLLCGECTDRAATR